MQWGGKHAKYKKENNKNNCHASAVTPQALGIAPNA